MSRPVGFGTLPRTAAPSEASAARPGPVGQPAAPAAGSGPVREFHYRSPAPALGHFPGHHRSARGESGFELRGHAPLLDAPDPRRLDLHASLRDPFGSWIVRVYSQRRAIPVVLVADLSASMGFEGRQHKLEVLADFSESLAWSAWRTGDAFGFIGCDEQVRADWLLPPARGRGVGTPIAQRLRGRPELQGSARGLLDAHRYLRRQRSLVFLVSDFHLPPAQLESLFASLARHQLTPIVLRDPTEHDLGPGHGLVHAIDPETGERRLVLWRPSLRKAWARARQQQRQQLEALCHRHRLRPLWIEGGFDADALTRHFVG